MLPLWKAALQRRTQKARFQEHLSALNHDARGMIFVSQRNEWSKIPPTHTPTEPPL